jgi:hypothetical protein
MAVSNNNTKMQHYVLFAASGELKCLKMESGSSILESSVILKRAYPAGVSNRTKTIL